MFKKFVLLIVAASLALGGVAHAQTNYPTEATVEIRDGNGNLIGEAGVTVGDPLTVFSTGWAVQVEIQATWFSDPVDLGRHRSNDKGEVRFTFNVPDVPPIPGIHTLRLEGTGANGQPRRVDIAIKVNARPGNTTTPRPTVLGSSLDNNTTTGGSSTSAFAKTGAFLARSAYVGFALLAIGAALYVAVRKRNLATR